MSTSYETMNSPEPRVEVMDTIKKYSDEILKEGKVPTITNKEGGETAPSGDPHDYASVTRYKMWRTESGGLDWVDGEMNPDFEKYTDNKRMEEARAQLFFTATAAIESHNNGQVEDADKYSAYASQVLRKWFVDEKTRMNPRLEYAHIVRKSEDSSEYEDKGNYFGIIEGDDLLLFVEESSRLEELGLVDQETLSGMKQWYGEYLDWLTKSEMGIRESGMENNHGTMYDVQVATVADFVGRDDIVIEALNRAKGRIGTHIENDGSQPLEMHRQDSYGYPLYNLYGYSRLSRLGVKHGVDIWNYEAPSGGSLRKAFEFYLDNLPDADEKPIQSERHGQLFLTMRAAAEAYGDQRYFDVPTKYFPEDQLEDEITKDWFSFETTQ